MLLNGLIAGGICRKERGRACNFLASTLQQSKAVLDQKKLSTADSSSRSSPVVYQHDFVKLTWAEHKTWVHISTRHSVMLLFTSKTFQQHVMQESLDTVQRFCTKGHHNSHRTPQQSKQMFAHRKTDCVTQITIQQRLNFIKNCVTFCIT